MQPQQDFNNNAGAPNESGAIACAQCGAPMPSGMRFCRSCGNRLGEGPAEYTETVRLGNATGPQFNSGATEYSPITRHTGSGFPYKKKRRVGGMTWVLIAIAALFVFGGFMTMVKKNVGNFSRATAPARQRSHFLGVNEFKDADGGGATFANVYPPDSPADKAGLVGGDVITSFNGHSVEDEDEMMDLLRETPIGKTVDVTYRRDGEIKTTKLITIAESEFNALESAFRSRPEGPGMFGFETDKTTVITEPVTKTFGVRLDYVEPNSPADLFGIREGDIITEFDKAPIRTSEELLSRVRRAIPRSVVEVTVARNGEILKIPVTMGRSRR